MYELRQGLELRQTLTPQQILLSTLLQLPSLALEQRISTELELNPVLELVEDTEDTAPEEEESTEEKTDEEIEKEKTDEDRMDEIDIDDYFGNDGYEARQQKDNSKEEHIFQNPYKPTLAELLLDQIKELNLSPNEEQILEDLIWSIDEGGYLLVPLEYVAEKFEVDIATIEGIHAQLMTLNPIGIGARNLQECLLVQAQKYHPDTTAFYIIRDYFVDFANKRYERILRSLGIDKDEMMQAEEIISHYNPKPGDGAVSLVNAYITPDFYIREEDGEFLVTLNDAFIPDLRISGVYLDMIKNQKKLDVESKSYLKKKLESAKWFVNSIQMRRITMMKVIHAIITRQKDFFLYGQEHLRPMVLRDIAEDISMDISTISRVTSGKYAQTDWGIYDLRYFFSEGIEAEDGENISTRRIKDRLKVIISEEDKNKPISDEALSKILQKEGFPIARRTVAKYREQLQLPVARLRREI